MGWGRGNRHDVAGSRSSERVDSVDSRWQGRAAVCRVTAGGARTPPGLLGGEWARPKVPKQGLAPPFSLLRTPQFDLGREAVQRSQTHPQRNHAVVEFMGLDLVAGVRHSAWWCLMALASFVLSRFPLSNSQQQQHEMAVSRAPPAVSDHASVPTGWSATFPGRGASTNGLQQFVWLQWPGREP